MFATPEDAARAWRVLGAAACLAGTRAAGHRSLPARPLFTDVPLRRRVPAAAGMMLPAKQADLRSTSRSRESVVVR